jgi:flavin reductase (DIM6/NTAB) family NADH-FMN oxidoreductase RutF
MILDGETDLQATFRDVMADVATPVCVVTALFEDGPHGTTVSAFASLSMNPPMVLVSLHRTSGLLAVIRLTMRFGVNILGSEHAHWARTFARKGGTAKFGTITWTLDSGVPRLPGTGWLACRVADLIDGGDHVLILGDVAAAQAAGGPPLTYHGRAFGTHAALDLSGARALQPAPEERAG